MRITIDIASPVLEEARRLTRKEGVTLSALVTEGLHTVVAAREARKGFRLRDAGFSGLGVQEGVVEGRWFEIAI